MKTGRYYPWLSDAHIIMGAEGEAAGTSTDDSGNDQGSDDSSTDKGDASGSSDASKKVHDDADDPKVIGLKTALGTERARAEAAEKELKKLRKAEEDAALAKKTDIEQANAKAEAATEKATRLAAGLLKRDLDQAIKDAASKLNFIDVDDALAGVDRSKLVFTQDDDDPTDISIDLKVLETQVKGLAAKKPHFIKTGTTDGEATGSQFGGKPPKKKTDADTLKDVYPALR